MQVAELLLRSVVEKGGYDQVDFTQRLDGLLDTLDGTAYRQACTLELELLSGLGWGLHLLQLAWQAANVCSQNLHVEQASDSLASML